MYLVHFLESKLVGCFVLEKLYTLFLDFCSDSVIVFIEQGDKLPQVAIKGGKAYEHSEIYTKIRAGSAGL